MVLTNAQQARFRTHLKERAGSPSEVMRATCLTWLKGLREEVIRDEAEPEPTLARIEMLRNEIEEASDFDRAFAMIVNRYMENRFRRTR